MSLLIQHCSLLFTCKFSDTSAEASLQSSRGRCAIAAAKSRDWILNEEQGRCILLSNSVHCLIQIRRLPFSSGSKPTPARRGDEMIGLFFLVFGCSQELNQKNFPSRFNLNGHCSTSTLKKTNPISSIHVPTPAALCLHLHIQLSSTCVSGASTVLA